MAALRAYPPGPVAPWAEVVPDAPYPMTVDDLLAWPDDDGYRYEVVEGVLVRMAGTWPAAGASCVVSYARSTPMSRRTIWAL